MSETQDEPLTDEQIVEKANELARMFYASMGYAVKRGYRFDQATHPQELEMAFKRIQYKTEKAA